MRRQWITVPLLAAFATWSLFFLRRDAPRSSAVPHTSVNPAPSTIPEPAPEPEPLRVRVDQTIVKAEPMERPVSPHARTPGSPAAPPRRPVRKTVAASQEERAPSSRLLVRAARALVGNGRHKPQPFPRAN